MIGKSNINTSSNLNFRIGIEPKTPTGSYFLPDTAKENTILIQTETPISSWSFSYSEPSQPSQGQVWFQYENNLSSTFSIFKDQKVNIRTSFCEQYNGRWWEIKTFYIYQDGQWYEDSIYPIS